MERLVIVTGLSGSGKSLAGNCLEDLGFFCVDNLPVQLIPPFVDLIRASADRISRAAMVIDVREASFLVQLPDILEALRSAGAPVEVLFLECTDEVAKRRFSETRRPHPMAASAPTLEAAIRAEREVLAPIRNQADRILDTSRFSAHDLRAFLKNVFGSGTSPGSMNLNVLSFGFKYGVPTEADLMFDVRFLPNPYFVDHLRHRTGQDPAVREFLDRQPETAEFEQRLRSFVEFLIPRYVGEGKSYLTIAIGCTGGKHRSVAIADALAAHLRSLGMVASVHHRDLGRE